jgi:phosphoglycolate phosphatase
MIKAVLFDFDDTLVKTKEIRYKALKEAGRTFYNINISDQEIDKYWGQPFNPFISGIFRSLDTPEKLTENYKSILHKYPNEPFPKTNGVLKTLSKKYLLGVISSSHPDLIRGGMESTKIDPNLFFFIQSFFDTDVHKPNPEVFLPTIEKLKTKNIDKSEIIYVGDAIDDYEAASNAGLHFCGIANRTVNVSVFMEKNIPYLSEISSFPKFINKL